MSNGNGALWKREQPEIVRPERGPGSAFVTAEDRDRALGAIPLNSINDAIVAGVNLGYKVADTAVQRSRRFADGLRSAGDRVVGPHSDRKALDAAEKLVLNSLLSGLSWWEASVADGRCPVKRLATAELQMLGQLLGLTPAPAKSSPARPRPAGDEPERAERPRDRDGGGTAGRGAARPRRRIQVVHEGEPEYRRPVLVENWEIASAEGLRTKVYFFSASDPDAGALDLKAMLEVTGKAGAARLSVTMPPKVPPGRWRAAICDREAVQIGFIEIVL